MHTPKCGFCTPRVGLAGFAKVPEGHVPDRFEAVFSVFTHVPDKRHHWRCPAKGVPGSLLEEGGPVFDKR